MTDDKMKVMKVWWMKDGEWVELGKLDVPRVVLSRHLSGARPVAVANLDAELDIPWPIYAGGDSEEE